MIKLIHGDCLEEMQKLIDENVIVDNIITSPPYNFATKRKDCYYNNGYSNIDNLSEEEYLSNRIKEFYQFEKLLKEDGVICYNLNYHNENPILPFVLIDRIHDETKFTVADTISWVKPHSIPFQTSPTKLSRRAEFIFIIVNKECLHSFKTNKKISKINKRTQQKFYKNYTNVVYAKNNDRITSSHKATYSTDLVNQLIDIYVQENLIVLDPFMGIGTTGVACLNLNRDFIGIEKDAEYFNICKERIKK